MPDKYRFDEAISQEWQDFRKLPFPIHGIDEQVFDLATIDTYAAGCIDTFVRQGEQLDPQRKSILQTCHTDIEQILPSLSGETQKYFAQLHGVISSILATEL